MRVLVMGITGLFGGFLIPLLLIAAYRGISGSDGELAPPLAYAPETLALVGAVTVPVVDALVRSRRR